MNWETDDLAGRYGRAEASERTTKKGKIDPSLSRDIRTGKGMKKSLPSFDPSKGSNFSR